jgi:alanine racemase
MCRRSPSIPEFNSASSMTRATQAIIDLHALRENYRLAQSKAPNSKAYAVIKANAYGHGLLPCAQALTDVADGFAVACVDEAIELRQNGILLPVLVLEGAMDQAECQTAADLDLEMVVHKQDQVHWLAAVKGAAVRVWIKVDSGMHRLGFSTQEVPGLVTMLRGMDTVHDIHLMSHFACADESGSAVTAQQIKNLETLDPIKLERSLCNSAAILTLPQCHGELIRPGIMLYGGSPLQQKMGSQLQLQPVMTLQSEVIAMHELAAGEGVGYGHSFVTERPTTLAVVAIGYGDGYPRRAPPGTPVMIRGKKYPLAGRVSMDMITVDVTDSDVSLGDVVTLWGTGLDADEIAGHCHTISYELFCQVTPRVKRQYLGRAPVPKS